MTEVTHERTFELDREQLTDLLHQLDQSGSSLHPMAVSLQKDIRRLLARKKWVGPATITVTTKRELGYDVFKELLSAVEEM